MESNATADLLWTECRAIHDNGPGWSIGVEAVVGGERSRPIIAGAMAVLHVRVKELLRIIQIDDMEGLRDALGARTCAIQWKDNEGEDQSRAIFPELVIGVVAMSGGTQSSNVIDTMRDVLQECLQGLSKAEGSNILDAIHEGFIAPNASIVYELVRTMSQLKIRLKVYGDDDVNLHLHYTSERIAVIYRAYMIDIASSRGPGDLLRALDRQQHLDKATQGHIIEDLMRLISKDLWAQQSQTIARESIRWHYICHSARQRICCSCTDLELAYFSPYVGTFIFNSRMLEPVSHDANQAPYHLRLSCWREKEGCRVYYDAMDWWCFVSWPYIKRVISFGSNETLTRVIVFPPRLDVLKYIVTELSNPTSAPGIQYPAATFPNYEQGEGFGDLVEEFELAPFMPYESQRLSSSLNPSKADSELRSCLEKHFDPSLVSTMLRTGVYPAAGAFSYSVAGPRVTTNIITEIVTALNKAVHDAGETASFLSEPRKSHLLRCISQYREAFAMTRLLKYGLHLYTAASSLIHMLPQ